MRTSPLLCLVLAFALASCSSEGGNIVRVDVRTDWVPVVEFAEVEVTLDDGARSATHTATFEQDFLAGMRVANLEGVATGSHRVRARLLAEDGRRVAEQVVDFRVSGPRTVTIPFTRNCDGIACPESGDEPTATQCIDARCVNPECSPENLDACPTTCSADGDCPAPDVGCARAVCSAGSCFVGSDAASCGVGEYCNPELGCLPRPGAGDMGPPTDMGRLDSGLPAECGQPCDTGDGCEVGVFDCSSGTPVCVRDRLLDAGTSCRPVAGPCDVEEVCDGSSPACPIDRFTPTGTTCPSGFCDGLGACSAGCTPGASCSTGNVCETGTISCDGGTPVCERSGNADDGTSCAATENGSWSACGGYSGTCDETGTRSRNVTRYSCQSGACAPSSSTGTEACGRDTDGGSCGSVSYGSWGSCGGFTSICDETGTESRTVTTPVCSGGSCADSTSSESRPCSRDTDGTSCGSPPFPCFARICSAASCQRVDTCSGTDHCCEFGCRPSGTECD